MLRRRALSAAALVTLALVAVLSACGARTTTPAPRSASFPCAPRASGARDQDDEVLVGGQPTESGLLAVRGKVVILTEPPSEIDVDALTASAIPAPGGAQIVELASDGRGLWALAWDAARRPRLFERASSSWRERALPEGTTADDATVLAVDGDVLVLLSGARLSTLERGRWSSRAVAPVPRSRAKHRALLHRRVLYVGRDEGEWGGDLSSIAIDTGAWQKQELLPLSHGLELPVRDLARAPDGALWAVRGLAHLVVQQGQLFRRDAGGWKLVASSSGLGALPGTRPDAGQCGGDWNLPSTNFDAIAFDASGRALLLTGTLGIVRREPGGGWTRLTTRWPSFVSGEGIAAAGGKIVVGTSDSGPAVLEPESGRLQRIKLP